jgi:hypothetical protein
MSEALGRILSAQESIHAASCPMGSDPAHRLSRCLLTPDVFAVADALDVLDETPEDVRGAALALHDRVCSSDCPSAAADPGRTAATDHARRTQSRRASALRRFVSAERRSA